MEGRMSSTAPEPSLAGLVWIDAVEPCIAGFYAGLQDAIQTCSFALAQSLQLSLHLTAGNSQLGGEGDGGSGIPDVWGNGDGVMLGSIVGVGRYDMRFYKQP